MYFLGAFLIQLLNNFKVSFEKILINHNIMGYDKSMKISFIQFKKIQTLNSLGLLTVCFLKLNLKFFK